MENRTISAIALDISQDWQNVNFAAKPYLSAMRHLDTMRDTYYADSAASVVRYFLANAAGYRGERARALKAELKALLSAPR